MVALVKLSEHFNLSEFEDSATAKKHGIKNHAPVEMYGRLITLCENVLEPVREHFGKPVKITSGYRCMKLNSLIGSKDDSQHVMCEAADIVIAGVEPLEIARFIHTHLSYDQCIQEHNRWVHVSYTMRRANREETLTAYEDNEGKTKYYYGLEGG